MASQERIKLINAEAKAKENLKKVEADLAKMEKARAEKSDTYSAKELAKLEAKKKKVEDYLQKVKGIKDGVDDFKNLTDSISLSSKSTAELSKALSIANKNLQAISSVAISLDYNNLSEADAKTAEFVKEFQAGSSKLAQAQSDLQNADPNDKAAIAAYEKSVKDATTSLGKSIDEAVKLGVVTKPMAQAAFDFVKAQRSVNKEISATVGLTEEEIDQYRELTSEADKMNNRIQAFVNQISVAFAKPRVRIGLLIMGFGSVVNKIGEVNRELGTTLFQTDGVGRKAGLLSIFFKDAASTAKQLSNELGSTARATFELQTNVGLMAVNFGVSNSEAATLVGSFTRLNGNSTDIAQDMMTTTRAFAQQNNIIPGALMADLANSTEEFALFGGKGGENILRAAGYAQRLGVNMSTLSKITEGLLDFESSINNELELGVMLGKNLNLNKARELAFNNDIEGATREVLKQVGGIAAFERMNYYQRQQTAKTLGISVSELQKMVTNEKEAGQLGGVIKEEFSQVNELVNGGLNKYLGTSIQALGGMLMTATQFGAQLSMMGFNMKGLISRTLLVGKNIAAWALGPVLRATKGITSAVANSGLGKAVVSRARNIRNRLLQGASSKVDFSKTADRAETATKIDRKTPKGKSGLSSLAKGLKDMGTGKVLAGALNLIPTALGFVAILPGIPGMISVALLGGPAGGGLFGLAKGLRSMGTSKVLLGALNLIPTALGMAMMTLGIPGMLGVSLLGVPAGVGLTALGKGLQQMSKGIVGSAALVVAGLGFMAMTLGIPGMIGVSVLGIPTATGLTALAGGLTAMTAAIPGSAALALAGVGFTLMTLGIPGMIGVALLGAPASAGLIALSVGLTSFGAAAMNPLLWLGIGALGALGLALIPMSASLAIAAPAISAFGDVLKGAFQGVASVVTAISNGLVSLLGVITLDKALAMGAFAGSIAALGLAGLAAMPGLLVLGLVGPRISNLLASLTTATPAITAFGQAIKSSFDGVASVVTALGDSMVNMMSVITLEKAAAMISLGAAFPLLALGIGSLAIAATLGGGKVTSFIQGIAESASLLGGGAASNLQMTSQALFQMGSAIGNLNEQIDRLNVEKLEKLEDFSVSLSVGGAVTTIGNAVGGMVDAVSSLITGDEKEGVTNEPKENPLLNEIVGLRKDLTDGKVAVYMDSELVSRKVRATFDKSGKNRMGSLNDSTGG